MGEGGNKSTQTEKERTTTGVKCVWNMYRYIIERKEEYVCFVIYVYVCECVYKFRLK